MYVLVLFISPDSPQFMVTEFIGAVLILDCLSKLTSVPSDVHLYTHSFFILLKNILLSLFARDVRRFDWPDWTNFTMNPTAARPRQRE